MRRSLDVAVDQVLGFGEPAEVHLELNPRKEGLERQTNLRLVHLHRFQFHPDIVHVTRQVKQSYVKDEQVNAVTLGVPIAFVHQARLALTIPGKSRLIHTELVES